MDLELERLLQKLLFECSCFTAVKRGPQGSGRRPSTGSRGVNVEKDDKQKYEREETSRRGKRNFKSNGKRKIKFLGYVLWIYFENLKKNYCES